MKKKVLGVVFVVILVLVGKYVYDVNVNYNFKEITENKVYKSGVIPPNKIEDYTKKYHIKSIIDLMSYIIELISFILFILRILLTGFGYILKLDSLDISS